VGIAARTHLGSVRDVERSQ